MNEAKFQQLLEENGFKYIDSNINGFNMYSDGEIRLWLDIEKEEDC